MKKEKVIYYNDELNDEFSGVKEKDFKLNDDYQYIHKNVLWKIGEFFFYRVIMTPVAFFYLKFKFHFKVINKKVLKGFKKHGIFLYGNHTNVPADAYIPNMVVFPQKCYVIVNSQNVAIKGTRTFMSMVGALPIPDSFKGMRSFIEAVEKRSVQGNAICVYPEAHIWPYYTKIRPFKSASFRYPIQFGDPSFAFTTTYQKRKHSKKPKIVVYVDGPFYGDLNLSEKERKEDLRNRIYNAMVERSKNSNIEVVKYVKKGE